MEIGFLARLGKNWREIPQVCGRRGFAFLCLSQGCCVPWMLESHGTKPCRAAVLSVCAHSEEEVAEALVLCTCCPKRFSGYIILVLEKLESLPPCAYKSERKYRPALCKAEILGSGRSS